MRLKQFQIDAFARQVFRGNPAAVVPLDAWLSDELLQAIAEENNLSETAFFVPTEEGFHLRWFTPVAEVDLCGHATLASAHVIFEILGYGKPAIQFATRSGTLVVELRDGLLSMNFPAIPPQPSSPPAALIEGLGHQPIEVRAADDYIAVFDSEAVVRSISPNLAKLKELGLRGVSVTAPGLGVDFVSRFFAPKFGIPEDPVTGSAHCELAPCWASKLGKATLTAQQVSKRGGDLLCEMSG
ncbi:MAG: PhzF family phenazine biosynthesis protein, partial [Desulfobacterales bacterium]|nr:PhzF family phenazine biosynthesis protein [Desulfobacterales bacterium]